MEIRINVQIVGENYLTIAERSIAFGCIHDADSIAAFVYAAGESVQAALRDISRQLDASDEPEPEMID